MLCDSADAHPGLPESSALEDAVIKALELREIVLGMALNELTLLADLMLLELGRRSHAAIGRGRAPERRTAA